MSAKANLYGLPLAEAGSREFDFISLGGLIQRFDSGRRPYRKATSVDIHVSGAEFNPAANLSDCFRLNVRCVLLRGDTVQ